ncbi:hypothetical protein BpHYR1_002901 [Brachionus plicatilis]|uniref:Uncharacterized protein n=1 Tax=Brachionus plicatilis TaxID=10195 RepID=A0A3M7QAY9_BRAPC|nr:hypothetical protein BpHYR1_002901 [Brachionus plicatilis]
MKIYLFYNLSYLGFVAFSERPKHVLRQIATDASSVPPFKVESFVNTTLCNFRSCISYQGLLNSANLAEIRFEFVQALCILQRFCTSLADFDNKVPSDNSLHIFKYLRVQEKSKL